VLLASIFGSFLFGAALGTVAFVKIGPIALLAPILFLCYIVGVDYFTPIADVREIDPTQDKELQALFGNIKSLLPPDVGIFRLAHHKAGRYHHAPDFGAWVDRVPRQWRVVILVISPLTQFDQETATSLLTAVQRLRSQGRTLVISGMNRVQFKALENCGLTKVIDLDNFVPDLEFAIARGMNLATINPE
jgi:anti-anti-sigma regulatory factor